MQIAFPELAGPATIVLDKEQNLTDQDYEAFCLANRDLPIERTANGEIIIMPPAGGDSDYRSVKVISQLDAWAETDGSGKAFGSSISFILPDGSALSPDAAWVSNLKLAGLTKQQRSRFLRLAPDFVVEVMSPSDRLATAQDKMRTWLSNGVQLAWLIDADSQIVHIFQQGQAMKTVTGVQTLSASAPINGFTLKLERIWEGL